MIMKVSMQLGREDLIRYIYTVGVAFSAVYLHGVVPGGDVEFLAVLSMLLAFPWTLYYKFIVVSKLELMRAQADESGE